jgi:hypothetical protein
VAVYAPAVGKTFFVYGGTTGSGEQDLLAMVSYYDHLRNRVPKPTVIHDKEGVDDPHDNPSISLDDDGYVWVFVSGRGRHRPGFKYRSVKPYDLQAFERVTEEEFTYPQPWWLPDSGFLHLFTMYTDGRELYWSRSDPRGREWSVPRKLAGMGGHYQISNQRLGKVVTAFNMHPGGDVDKRTNLYFLQTDDQGKSWRTAAGNEIQTPLTDPASPALVREYSSEDRLVYLKDIGFDLSGKPVLLFITSRDHRPGPEGDPRMWTVAHWKGGHWEFHEVTSSTHNYDMGSLYLEATGEWRIIGPTEPGPQHYGTGGEMALWVSSDEGKSWTKTRNLTEGSERNHGYARRPVNVHPDFYAFWGDGDADRFSESHLYFTDRDGSHVWHLPYDMNSEYASPVPLFRK